jgi:SAM-dependent methyltransferase
MSTQQDAYDAVAYPNFINPESHPNRMAVMARLYGLDPAPIERCRVLEIGCNEAQNLIPMAYAIPGSEFVGFDLAAKPIARGQQRIQQLGLKNIRIFQADLLEVDETLGAFDYIIAHGVYAWVPQPVRDGLLALCQRLLTPQGIAFISYNALPGSHIRNLVRDVLLHRLATVDQPELAVTQPVEFLEFLAECRPPEDPLRALLESQAKKLREKKPAVIFHDEMTSGYGPVSFAELVAHAAQNGLQYVSDSSFPGPNDPCFQPHVAALAKTLAKGDPIAEEQTLDFARMRMYRETLLCHADLAVRRDVDLRALKHLRLASPAQPSPAEDPDTRPPGLRVYTMPDENCIECYHTGTILLMDLLVAAWPESISMQTVEQFLADNGVAVDAELLTMLFRLVISRMIRLNAWQAPVARQVASSPRASATSLQEAAVKSRVATLIHTAAEVSDPLVHSLLLLLDGTRDRDALIDGLRTAHPEVPAETLSGGLEPALRFLNHSGVLLAEDFAG